MRSLFSRRERQYLDMTEGNPVALIWQFSLPLIIGNLFQQFYSFTDAAIIGNYIGVNGFAAITCASWVIWVINAASRDSSNAFSIAASYRIGRKDEAEFRKIVGNAVTAGCLLAVLIVCGLLVFMRRILTWLSVPAEIFGSARTYLIIFVLTVPFGFGFHITAGLLRAAGNSTVTFRAMTVSTIVNIALDLLFIVVFRWSVAGAAFATMIAQACAMAVALAAAARADLFQLRREDLKLDRKILGEIVRLWAPMMFNTVVITAGGLYVQKVVNSIGAYFVAGVQVSLTIFSVCEAVIMAIMVATGVFVGQNLGAEKPHRIRSGFHRILLATFALTFVMIALVLVFNDRIVSFLLKSEDPEIMAMAHRAGVLAVQCITWGMLVMTPMYLYRFSLQTMGHQRYVMVAAVLQMIARFCAARFLPAIIGEYAYYLADTFAWIVSLPTVAIPFYHYLNDLCRKKDSICRNTEKIPNSSVSPPE